MHKAYNTPSGWQEEFSTKGLSFCNDEKLYDLLAVRLIKARDLAELDAFDPDPRHVERDKRTRKSPVESGILALT
jgi:hypothetical protein